MPRTLLASRSPALRSHARQDRPVRARHVVNMVAADGMKIDLQVSRRGPDDQCISLRGGVRESRPPSRLESKKGEPRAAFSRTIRAQPSSADVALFFLRLGVDVERPCVAYTTSSEMTTSCTPPAPEARTSCRAESISMIERRPRAPVLRSMARLRSPTGVLVEGQVDISHLEQALVLLDQRVLRLGQDLDQRRSSRSSSVASTGQAADEFRGSGRTSARSSGSTGGTGRPCGDPPASHRRAEADRRLAATVRD